MIRWGNAYQPVVKVVTAFDRPCIPADCVAIGSHTPGMLPHRALSGGRRTGLGARETFTTDCYVEKANALFVDRGMDRSFLVLRERSRPASGKLGAHSGSPPALPGRLSPGISLPGSAHSSPASPVRRKSGGPGGPALGDSAGPVRGSWRDAGGEPIDPDQQRARLGSRREGLEDVVHGRSGKNRVRTLSGGNRLGKTGVAGEGVPGLPGEQSGGGPGEPDALVQHVILDPQGTGERRYKGVLGPRDRRPVVSADGYEFTILEVPPIPSQDTSQLTYDELGRQYILTVKHRGPSAGRSTFH